MAASRSHWTRTGHCGRLTAATRADARTLHGVHVTLRPVLLACLAALTSVAACANDAKPTTAATPAALPTVAVYKSPSCSCCEKWVGHLREAGFEVEVHDVDNVHPVKMRVGLPPGKGSCHTAEVAGYFLEGHVPAADVKRLLTERPTARGLAVPGMPAGSPGMELPDGRIQPFDVELIAADGTSSRFSRHGD